MKKLLFLLIATVLTNIAMAQVTIPDSVATKVIEELLVKDQLAFEVIKQDSIITVLKVEHQNQVSEIEIYKTKEVEYQKIIASLNQIIAIKNAESKDLQTETKHIKARGVKTVLILAAIAILEGVALMFK